MKLKGILPLCCVSLFAFAQAASPIPKGHGAILYDAQKSSGPNSSESNSPGFWNSNIYSFNQGANSQTLINRLYVYSAPIKVNCDTAANCIYSGSGQNVTAPYNTSIGGYGQASVNAYRTYQPTAGTFPFANSMILAIFDTDLGSYPLLNDPNVGTNVSNMITGQICADPNVDGVFFDLEPITPAAFSSPGLFNLYHTTATKLASCKDSKHPNGRYMGVFINPNKISDWNDVAAALGNNGFVVVGAYDINDTTPPSPTAYSLYTSSLTGKIQAYMDPSSTQNHIAYSVAIPAASSFSEFEQFGTWEASPPNFSVITDYRSQYTQLQYVKTAKSIIQANAKSAYYIGIDYWSWSQFKSPAPNKGWLLEPAIPASDVIAFLQQNA